MYKIKTFILLILLPLQVWSQKRSKVIFGELLGQTSLVSLNYDTRFEKGKVNGWGMRVGAGLYSGMACEICDFVTGGIGSFPVSVNYLLGKKNHHLELGTGVTFHAIKKNNDIRPFIGFNGGKSTKNYGSFTVGYRYQEIQNFIVLGIAWNPVYNQFGMNPKNGGVFLGFNF